MAFKGLFGVGGGDLNTSTDFYGYYNDTVYVVYQPTTRAYTINTYRGNDLIDLRDANATNGHEAFGGLGNDTVLGGLADDNFRDQSGNDTAILGAGNDEVSVGLGNDLYVGGDGVDTLSFALFHDDFGNASNLTTGVRYDAAITRAQNLGFLGVDRISGFERVIGSYGNDTLSGSVLGDNFQGGEGNDILVGRIGSDFLSGGAGADLFIGGVGGDRMLMGGADGVRDIVRYTSMRDSGVQNQANIADRIVEFDRGTALTSDRIDLSAIDAVLGTKRNDAFIFRGAGAFTSRGGEVRLEIVSNVHTLVHVDIDGDTASEMVFLVENVVGLDAGDFFL